MPTVARIGPYRFFFYSNEGDEPPHVHVEREAWVAKFWLSPVMEAVAGGFSKRELHDLARIVRENQQVWIRAWDDYFNG